MGPVGTGFAWRADGDFDAAATADADAAIDPPFLRDRLEKVFPVPDGFGCPETETPFAQREVKQGCDLLLHGLFEIDQQVAAADQVQS